MGAGCSRSMQHSPNRTTSMEPSLLRHPSVVTKATVAPEASTSGIQAAEFESDRNGVQRLRYRTEGWNYRTWNGYKTHYVQAGEQGSAVVLVHGFGASAYHWRYNIPELAKNHKVYAIDLLGFGWGEKPVVEYTGYGLWAEQLSDFIREVVGERAVVVGNSLGGYNCLATAAKFPELVSGVVLVNAAGRFEDIVAAPVEEEFEEVIDNIQQAQGKVEAALQAAEQGAGRSASTAQRVEAEAAESHLPAAPAPLLDRMVQPMLARMKKLAIYGAFFYTKQPARIRQVLQQVYVSQANIDDDLVKSIQQPAQDSNGPEVFYRIISANGTSVNQLLQKVKAPLFLLWGNRDPWITPSKADLIVKLYPGAERVGLDAGHCPHDDKPREFNDALVHWLDRQPTPAAL